MATGSTSTPKRLHSDSWPLEACPQAGLTVAGCGGIPKRARCLPGEGCVRLLGKWVGSQMARQGPVCEHAQQSQAFQEGRVTRTRLEVVCVSVIDGLEDPSMEIG